MDGNGDKQEKLAIKEWQVVRQSKRGRDQEQISKDKEGTRQKKSFWTKFVGTRL
jgi:hypothetical protein